MDPHHSQIKPKFAQFRTYPSLGQARPCPSNLITRKIRPSSQWSAVIYPATFSPSFPHIVPHCLQVSDKSGFGTGGASTSVTVLQSSDSSCYSSSKPTQFAWVFSIEPTGGLTQCESVRLWWEAPFVNGCVSSSILPNSVRPNSFIHHDTYRHVEPSTFTAPSQAALPLPSLKAHFLVTMTQALGSIGRSVSPVGPMSSLSGTTIEELDPAVVLDSLLHMRRTIPV